MTKLNFKDVGVWVAIGIAVWWVFGNLIAVGIGIAIGVAASYAIRNIEPLE